MSEEVHVSNIAGMLGRFMLAILVLVGGGCFLETPPRVSVQGVNLLAVGTDVPPSAKLGIDIQLENPTRKPIQLELYNYTLFVDTESGSNRWSGEWSALRTLPAGRTVDMVIPAVVPYDFAEAMETARWRVSGWISYKAPGRLAQILFDTGFRRPEHGFSGQGTAISKDGPEAKDRSTDVN